MAAGVPTELAELAVRTSANEDLAILERHLGISTGANHLGILELPSADWCGRNLRDIHARGIAHVPRYHAHLELPLGAQPLREDLEVQLAHPAEQLLPVTCTCTLSRVSCTS